VLQPEAEPGGQGLQRRGGARVRARIELPQAEGRELVAQRLGLAAPQLGQRPVILDDPRDRPALRVADQQALGGWHPQRDSQSLGKRNASGPLDRARPSPHPWNAFEQK